MDFDSKIWGSKVWYAIHQIAYNYIREKKTITVSQKRNLRNFYGSLRHLLPCPSCRDHYSRTLSRAPVLKFVTNGSTIFAWTVRAHNLANKGLKKKVLTVSEATKIHSAPFNETAFQEYVKYILLLSTNKKWTERRLHAVCLILLYPASKSRTAALAFATKENPRNLKGAGAMNKWAKKLYDVIRKA